MLVCYLNRGNYVGYLGYVGILRMGTNDDRTTRRPEGKHIGRPVKYYNPNDRWEARKASKRRHNHKPWTCDVCHTTYTIRGKGMHCKSIMHKKHLQ